MTVQQRLLNYQHQSTQLQGYYACAGETARPGVLIAPMWNGRGAFVEGVARDLAELGYAAMALDMYGEGKQGNGPEENAALMAPLVADRPLLQARMQAALSTLLQQPEVDPARVVVAGYCFGGLCALDLARTGARLAGAVSFHGLLHAPGNTAENRFGTPILVLHGWDDPMVPPQQVLDLQAELSAAGADWQLHSYGNTVHAFTNPEANDKAGGAAYDAVVARRAWQSFTDFLAEVCA